MKILASMTLGIAIAAMSPTPAPAQQYSPAADSAEFKAMAVVVDAAIRGELKQTVVVDIESVTRNGDWAFVMASLLDSSGRAYRYIGTPLEDAAANGGVSNAYAALLRSRGSEWTLVTQVIGPGDVAWDEWPSKYGAPAALFGF